MSAAAQTREPDAPVIEEIEIASITRDVTVRAKGTDRATVLAYAEAMRAGAKFPPIVVYRDRHATRLSEGAHRIEAALATGQTTIAAEIRSGGKKECIVHGVATGRDFGLRFSTRDKRHQCALMLGNFPKWSDRKIAEAVGVDHKTVAATRRRIADSPGKSPHGNAADNSPGNSETPPQTDPNNENESPKLARGMTAFRKLLGSIPESLRAEFSDRVLAILSESRT